MLNALACHSPQGRRASSVDAVTVVTVTRRAIPAPFEHQDVAQASKHISATLLDTDEDGHQADKRSVLEALRSGHHKIASVSRSRMRIYAYGDAAVVTGTAAQTGTFMGQALAPRVIFTDTFVSRGDVAAVTSHRSPVHDQ